MNLNHTSTHDPSAGEGLHTYGLAGIDLQRAAERRMPTRAVAHAGGHQPEMLHRMRLGVGEAMIRLGMGIAGESATRRVGPAAHPTADMA